MLCQLEGVLSGSDFYFLHLRLRPENQLFYFTSIGHFFCDYGYRVERQDYGNYLLLYVKKGEAVCDDEGRSFMQGKEIWHSSIVICRMNTSRDQFHWDFCGSHF